MISHHSFFKKIDGRSIELLLAISGTRASATVLYLEQGKEPRKLYEVSQDTNIFLEKDNSFNRAKLKKLVSAVLTDVARENKKMYAIQDLFRDHQRIHNVHVMVGIPWVQYSVGRESVVFEKNKHIDSRLIEDMSLSENRESEKLLDKDIMSISVNAYPIPLQDFFETQHKKNIIGKSADILYVDTNMRDANYADLVSIISQSVGVEEKQINFVSAFNVLQSTAADLYNHSFDNVRLILANSAGYEIFTINDRHEVQQSHIYIGSAKISAILVEKKIAHSNQEAASYIQMLLRGQMEEKLQRRIIAAVQPDIARFEIRNDLPNFFLGESGDVALMRKLIPEQNIQYLSGNKNISEYRHIQLLSKYIFGD